MTMCQGADAKLNLINLTIKSNLYRNRRNMLVYSNQIPAITSDG